jgi:dienelactone hydrolase
MPRHAFRPIVVAVAACAVALAGSAGVAAGLVAEPSPFAYERSQPLAYAVHDARGGVREVSFAASRGGRVRGVLVVPAGRGPFPAVLYLHGAGGDRHQFVDDAKALARRGVAGLTIDSAWVGARTPASSGLAAVRRFRDLETATVVDLRRAVDLLRALPAIDGERIGFVGWSAGAREGAIFAGIERRVRSFVLVAGGAAPVGAYLTGVPPQLRGAVERLLTDVDPLRWVHQARRGTIFFQDGLHDEVVPRDALVRLAAAAPEPQRLRWYDAAHVPSPRMVRERNAWLAARLGT